MNRQDVDSAASLFGKVPARGDFFHSGQHGTAELAFASWLTSAVEQSEGQTPEGPVRFFVSPHDGSTLVGTWVASRDGVGRNFPLAVSCRVPADVESVQWSLVLGYYGSFFDEAERALASSAGADMALLDQTRHDLPVPHPSALPGLLQLARHNLASEHLHAFARRNFRGEPLGALAYALDTLQRAVALDEAELTVDMPVSADHDVFAWLELLSALLGPLRKPRAVLWSPRAARMLVGLGALSTQLLAYLNQPDHRSNRRWPLWTERGEAASAARAELDVHLLSALEADVTLAALIELLRSGAQA